jgi:hypothetical protein
MEKFKSLIGQVNTLEFALANVEMTLNEIKGGFTRLKNSVNLLIEAEVGVKEEAEKIIFPINASGTDPENQPSDQVENNLPYNKINFSLKEGESVPAGWTKIRLPAWLDDKFNDDEIDTLAKLTDVKEQFLAYCRKHKYAFLKTELELKTVFHIDRIQSLNSKTIEILQDVKINKAGP